MLIKLEDHIVFEEDCKNHEHDAFTTFSLFELSLNDDLDIKLVSHKPNFETKFLQNYYFDSPKLRNMV
jgi:hypothetical protein